MARQTALETYLTISHLKSSKLSYHQQKNDVALYRFLISIYGRASSYRSAKSEWVFCTRVTVALITRKCSQRAPYVAWIVGTDPRVKRNVCSLLNCRHPAGTHAFQIRISNLHHRVPFWNMIWFLSQISVQTELDSDKMNVGLNFVWFLIICCKKLFMHMPPYWLNVYYDYSQTNYAWKHYLDNEGFLIHTIF